MGIHTISDMDSRRAIKELAKRMDRETSLISIQQLLLFGHETSPSTMRNHTFSFVILNMWSHFVCFAVPLGGLVFEIYLNTMASPKSHQLWKKHIKTARNHNNPMMDQATFDQILHKEKGKYHGFVLMTTSNICPKSKRQLFFITFSTRYHGLSRMGIQILSYYGMTMKLTAFDSNERQQIAKNQQRVRFSPTLLNCFENIPLILMAWFYCQGSCSGQSHHMDRQLLKVEGIANTFPSTGHLP
jgi:hypothetical protein